MSVRYHDVARFDVEELVILHMSLSKLRTTSQMGSALPGGLVDIAAATSRVAPIYRMEWAEPSPCRCGACYHFWSLPPCEISDLRLHTATATSASQSRDSRRRLSGLLAGTLSTYLTANGPSGCHALVSELFDSNRALSKPLTGFTFSNIPGSR